MSPEKKLRQLQIESARYHNLTDEQRLRRREKAKIAARKRRERPEVRKREREQGRIYDQRRR
jgi:hypothetical protein